MPSVATRRRRAVNIQNRMEGGDEAHFPTATASAYQPSGISRPSSSSFSSSPSPSPSSSPSIFSLLSFSFIRPSIVSLTLLPLLLLLGYLYMHRSHVSLVAAASMLAITAAYLLGFVTLLDARLQSKQGQTSSQQLGGECICSAVGLSYSVAPPPSHVPSVMRVTGLWWSLLLLSSSLLLMGGLQSAFRHTHQQHTATLHSHTLDD